MAGFAAALVTLVMMLATEPSLAPVWDEGFTLLRLPRVRAWFRAMYDPAGFASRWRPDQVGPPLDDTIPPPLSMGLNTRARLMTGPTVSWFWPFAREEPHGHPPFYALVALLGDLLTPFRDELARARLGSILFFSATAGALFHFAASRYGPWAATASAGAFALHPHLFALGHYAHYDALLTCLWVGSILAFVRAVQIPVTAERGSRPGGRPRWGWALVFGVLAGCAAGTKLTGWSLPLPFLVWSIGHRDRRGLITLALAGIVAAVTLYAITPPWWASPVNGLLTFLGSNLTRAQTHPVPTLFLGTVYLTPIESLPWYNTLLWAAIATPVGILALGLVGVLAALRRPGRRLEVLVLLNLAFLLLLRALPHTPGHDGVRQFLPAFGCLAMVAGVGAGRVVERFGRWGKAIVAAALVEAVASVALFMPVPLSYFSPLCGGLPGAARLGMEPTYYWDALTNRALEWINTRTHEGRTIVFSAVLHPYFYLHDSGRLRPEALFFPLAADLDQHAVRNRPWTWYLLDRRLIDRFGPRRVVQATGGVAAGWIFTRADLDSVLSDWQWYIVQNRPGFFTELDRRLVSRYGPGRVISSAWGVPLVWAFSRDDVAASKKE